MSEVNNTTDTVKLRFRFREVAAADDFAKYVEDCGYNIDTITRAGPKYVGFAVKAALAEEVKQKAIDMGGHEAQSLKPKPLWP